MSNPRSGERFVWRATRASTDGEHCEFDLYLSPGAKVAARHRHPSQEERFTVVSGALQLDQGHQGRRLEAGEIGVIPAGVPHRWGNTDEAAHVIVRLTPALDIESFFASFCAVATAGRAARTGLPRNPFQLAVLLDAHRTEFAMANDLQQRLLSPVLSLVAAIGRRLGYRADLVPGPAGPPGSGTTP